MTQEDKDLLLKDLLARLPYGVKVKGNFKWGFDGQIMDDMRESVLDIEIIEWLMNGIEVRPYLRPMSSMTEEEEKEICILLNYEFYIDDDYALVAEDNRHRIRLDLIQIYIDYLNAHHFDYRGLIPMDLAIAVTEENNPYKE